MKCRRVQSLMDRYVNEGLPAGAQEPFESHLRGCGDCQQQLALLTRLVETLRSVPSPPVPRAFVDRVISRAQQEIRDLRASVEVRPGLPRWWDHVDAARLANAVAAVAAGLLLGLVLGQQTWRLAANTSVATRRTTSVDAEVFYSLDYLLGSPRGSFTETYLSLTDVASDQEF